MNCQKTVCDGNAAGEREIGCIVRNIPLLRFDEAVNYLQCRIIRTTLGKKQRGEGLPLYTEFEDFLG